MPRLAGVFPNPTRGRATVRSGLPDARPVRLSLVDLLGRTVATVADEVRAAGWHEVTVDTAALAAEAYVLRLDAGDAVRVVRLAVAR